MAAMTSRAAKPLAAAAIAQLEADGVATLIGTVVNPAGLTHAKTVPLRRMSAFADPGLGASPVFHVFAIDQTGIVFGDAIGVVGDQRIRIDLGALRVLGDGLCWAPGAFFNQDGSPDPYCSRGTLRRVAERLVRRGHRCGGRARDGVRARRTRRQRASLAHVGAVRAGGSARVRGVRPGCHRRRDELGGGDRTVPPRVRQEPVRDLAVAAAAGGRGRRNWC